MNTNWKIDTHGDPLGVLQKLVGAIWSKPTWMYWWFPRRMVDLLNCPTNWKI